MRKLFIAGLLFISVSVSANNVQLTNISVSNNITNTGKVIEFDVSWENSWRTTSTNNWDGVWVFFKFKDNDGKWYPLRFNGNNILMPSGFTHDMGNNLGVIGIGMFIYRSANGSGTATAIDVRAGIQSFPGTFEIRGYAIEMVYVPAGSFYLGDGNTTINYYRDSTAGAPYQVTGLGSTIQIGSAAGKLYDGLLTQPFTGNLGNFPTGYEAFWMMKYEVSQGAYRDFLNTLTYNQQAGLLLSATPLSPPGTCISCIGEQPRARLEIVTIGAPSTNIGAVFGCDNGGNSNVYNEPDDGEWRAMGGLISWKESAAYLDWAGLRPMTEMEFEKAARGPLTPVINEFTWGTPDIWSVNINSLYFVNDGAPDEVLNMSSAAVGNALYNSTNQNQPYRYFRGGMFASANSTRVSAGAGYYGAMEMSANLYEFTVTTSNAAGRSFSGKHGDGVLDAEGHANENTWPGINGNNISSVANTAYGGLQGVTGDAGILNRGGAHLSTLSERLRISYRPPCLNCEDAPGNHFLAGNGIRGVRNAN